ncbi:MAG TPA: KpsF/GutQ family sugar-phosphate isomerase [Melioribacteraceae bacterium]|nr:KpsF/GutQ family sugar-phosphate isomerase [Melioribacteraceae bacterium]
MKLSDKELIDIGKNVIKVEAESINELIERVDKSFAKAVKLIYKSKGRVVFSGMGKSGLIARKIVATMNSTGTAAIYLHPTDATHGDLGMVRKDDIVILISKSGYTEELFNLVPLFKRIGVPIIMMTGNINSKIAKECDVVLDCAVKEEACPYDLAPTASTTAALVVGDALAIVLLEMRGFTAEDFALLHPAGSLGKRLSLRISEIMYTGTDVPIVKEDSSLKDTIIEITGKRLGTTAVINSDNKLTGIITDGDLRRLLEKTTTIENLKAKDIMSKNPKTISSEFLASFALQQMEKFSITSLIVIDENNFPIGIIHLHDLVRLGLQTR